MVEALLTGGLGDVMVVDSFLSPNERASISRWYVASPAALVIQEMLSLAYPNIPVFIVDKVRVYYNKAQLEQRFALDLSHVRDLSIRTFFPSAGECYGSSLLSLPLDNDYKTELGRYIVFTPYTINQRGCRNFTLREYEAVVRGADCPLVVLYKGRQNIIKRGNVVDMSNRTTLKQTIDYLRGAHSYIGVDSALAHLSCQVHERPIIKSINPWYYNNLRLYAAGLKDTSCVVRDIR